MILFQAVWLDADEEGVRAAGRAGMKTILVENLQDALDKLVDFPGVQVQFYLCNPALDVSTSSSPTCLVRMMLCVH